MMYIPNQLIGAPRDTEITLECETEASPKVKQVSDTNIFPHICKLEILQNSFRNPPNNLFRLMDSVANEQNAPPYFTNMKVHKTCWW